MPIATTDTTMPSAATSRNGLSDDERTMSSASRINLRNEYELPPLLRAVDDVLAANTDGELQARLDRLRVLRADMLKHERAAKE